MNDQSTESSATVAASLPQPEADPPTVATPSLVNPDQHPEGPPSADSGGQAAELQRTDGAQPPFPEEVSINELQNTSLADLLELAETVGFRLNASRTKHQLIYDLCSWLAEHKTRLKVEGVLEIGQDNYGLIRYPKYSFTPLPEDVFVPLFLVRKFNLRPSQRIAGIAKAPKDVTSTWPSTVSLKSKAFRSKTGKPRQNSTSSRPPFPTSASFSKPRSPVP
jgi:transcription termination factor Rho